MGDNWIVSQSDRILITGANGYVGARVCGVLLEYGFYKLRCFVKPRHNLGRLFLGTQPAQNDIQYYEGNLLSLEDCRRAVDGVAVIYHLAAGVGKSFPGCFLNSAVTTRNLLEAARTSGALKRFVNVSSIAVYSNEKMKRRELLDESCEVDTRIVERHEPYTYGKAKQDEILLEYAHRYKLPYVIVRPSVVFGPGKAKISDRIGTDTFGLFLHLGLGNRIPLTYVDNCAEAIVLAGLKKGIDGEVFNITDDDLPTSRKFLRLYKRRVRKFLSIPVPYPIWYMFNWVWERYSSTSKGQLPPVFNRRACAVYWKGNTYSNRKAKELLGWKPRIGMDEALERFFAYMRERS